MTKKANLELATKIVEKLATHEHAEVEDIDKVYELAEGQEPKDIEFDKTKHHVYRFIGMGLVLVGADKDKDTAHRPPAPWKRRPDSRVAPVTATQRSQ